MTSQAAMALEYRVRAHAFDRETDYRLEPDRLVVTRDGAAEQIPLSAIGEVNLRQQAPGVFSTIVSRTGGKALRLTSQHFLGVGRFESRRPLYVPFVRGLIGPASQHGARITGGSSFLYLLGWLCLLTGTLLTLLMGYALVSPDVHLPMRVFVAVPIAFLGGIGLVRQGSAKTIDPKAPLANVFPA